MATTEAAAGALPANAESFFGQVSTSAPGLAFTTSDGGGLPRDLGNIYGPDGLNLSAVTPELVGGVTDVVAGVYRAVSGAPAPAPVPMAAPTTFFTPATLILGALVIGVLWFATRR